MQGFPNGAQFSSVMLTLCGLMDCSTPGFPVQLVVKKTPANAGHIRDSGSIPGLGSASGGGHGNPLQYSCLKNPMD